MGRHSTPAGRGGHLTAHLRQLIQNPGGFLFLPLIYRLAARLEQMEPEELTEDAASATYALRAAQKLFQLPAVLSHFRLGVEVVSDPPAFDAGALERPPLSVVLDTTQRLATDLKGQAGVVGVMTGPRTLMGRLPDAPANLADFYALLARAYAERGAELLLVAEDPAAPPARSSIAVLASMVNVARYFRLPTVLLDANAAEKPDGFDLLLGGAGLPLLPVDVLSEAPRDAASWRARSVPLLTTDTEVPPDQPAEQLLEWVTALN